MKHFVHEFHSGYGIPGRCSGVTSRSLSCGRLGGGRFGLRTPPSPPTGIEYGRGSRLCKVVHGILPKVLRSLSARLCGSVYVLGNVPSSGSTISCCDERATATARLSISVASRSQAVTSRSG